MSLTIIPDQTFEFSVGQYSSVSVEYNYTGSNTLIWSAVGLPLGLSIDQHGNIYGTPTNVGSRSSYITFTDPTLRASSVIKFNIANNNSTNITEFFVSPSTTGYAGITPFQFTLTLASSLTGAYILWDFGDKSLSNQQNPSHIYEVPGQYNVVLNVYSETQNVTLTSAINVNLLLNESIYFDFVPPPTFAGHLNRYPFTLTFTSSVSGPHYIDLAAQFSRSYQTQNPRNKWSFLRPEWRFLDLAGNPISSIVPSENPIYANEFGIVSNPVNGFFAGVTGTASFYFVDDIYNFDLVQSGRPYTTLIATLRTSAIRSFHDSFNADYVLPSYSNSLATASCPYTVLWRNPDNIAITENGVRDYINPRWPSAVQPLVAYTNYATPYPDPWVDGNGASDLWNPNSYAFCHNIPVNADPILINLVSVGFSANFVPQPTEFQWIDDTGYEVPGYYKGSFVTNISSANNVSLSANLTYKTPVLSSQYVNPTLWISNPEAGMMANVQYIYNPALSATFDTPNLNIAQVYPFDMPIITQPDFTNDPMALSGFHGINSIASLPAPTYHAWALDREMNYLYRISTQGQILCAVDINKVVSDNQLGFLVNNQVSPNAIVLDSQQNIWMTLYDTVSALKFDSQGNFLFATTPLSQISYHFPPRPAIDYNWYEQNTYYATITADIETLPSTAPSYAISSLDGSKIYVADGDIKIFDATSYNLLGSIPTKSSYNAIPRDLSLSENGNTLFAADQNLGVFVIDLGSNTITANIPSTQGGAPGGAFSVLGINLFDPSFPNIFDTQSFVVCYLNGVVEFYGSQGGYHLINTISSGKQTWKLAKYKNTVGNTLYSNVYATCPANKQVFRSQSIVSLSANNPISVVYNTPTYATTSQGTPRGIAVNTKNGNIYVSSVGGAGAVDVFNFGLSLQTSITVAYAQSVTLDNNNRYLYVAQFSENKISVIDTTTNTIVSTLPFSPNPRCIALGGIPNSIFIVCQNVMYTLIYRNLNNIDLNFLEPTGIDTDTNDNVWITYSNFMSGYLVKQNNIGNLLYTHSYPVCSCPQSLVVDNSNNVWVALSNNIYPSNPCYLEKRNTNGNKLSSFGPFRGLNKLTLDINQNPWFTFSYSWVGSIDNTSGTIFTTNLSGTGDTTYAADWFDPNLNTDETALEGIGCDILGNVYIINSIENQIYVLDVITKQFVNKFYINPQGFTFYLNDQYQPTQMSVSLWNKSAQADGDWTGLNWYNKYANNIPQYTSTTQNITITGRSVPLNFLNFLDNDIFKANENFDLAGSMQSLAFSPALAESEFLFNNFLGSIYGKYPFKHNDVGVKMYEKIANYVSNISDIDYCNVKEIYNLAKMMDINLQDFNLNYPEEVERVINFASVNLSRLLGARSVEQDSFIHPNSQGMYNMNPKPITSLNYMVTAGIPLVLEDRSLNKYRSINTGYINCSAVYTLGDFAKYLGFTNPNWPSYYQFHQFIPNYDGTQVAGLVDWNNPQTTIKENLSSANDWFGTGNLIDTQFSYELYKGLGLI